VEFGFVSIPVGGKGKERPFEVAVGKAKAAIDQTGQLVRLGPSSFQK
jgi:hypothetical protein